MTFLLESVHPREPRLASVDPTTTAPIRIAGRLLQPSPVFDTYWRFAAARHAMYLARVAGRAPS